MYNLYVEMHDAPSKCIRNWICNIKISECVVIINF